MTVQSIRERLAKSGKSISKPQLYRLFKRCDPPIRPVGAVRQHPQQYSPDAVTTLEELLGLRIVGLKTLRDVRRRAKAPVQRRLVIRVNPNGRKPSNGGAR